MLAAALKIMHVLAPQKEVEIWKRARESGAEEERLVVDVTERLETPQVTTEREVRALFQCLPSLEKHSGQHGTSLAAHGPRIYRLNVQE